MTRWRPHLIDALGATALACGLLYVCVGCATVTPTEPMCSTDGRPNLPQIETRFVGLEMTVACYITPEQPQVATLKIRSSEWIWTALSAAVASIATVLVAESEPPLAPDLWPAEYGPLKPSPRPKPRDIALQDPYPWQWAQLECGGVLQPGWCP